MASPVLSTIEERKAVVFCFGCGKRTSKSHFKEEKLVWVQRVLVPVFVRLLLGPLLCFFQFVLEKFRSGFTEEEHFSFGAFFHFHEEL